MRLFARRKSQPPPPSPDIFDSLPLPPSPSKTTHFRNSSLESNIDDSEMCRSDRYLCKLQKKEKRVSTASSRFAPKRPVRPGQGRCISSAAPQLVLDLSIDPSKLPSRQPHSPSFSITYQRSYSPSIYSQPTTAGRKSNHRRSRSFSTITNFPGIDPNVIGQPWRDREVWAALHTRLNEPLYNPSNAMEKNRWKGIGEVSVGSSFQRELGGAERSKSMKEIKKGTLFYDRKSSSENGHGSSKELKVSNPDPVPVIDQNLLTQKLEEQDVSYSPGYAAALYRSKVEEGMRSNRSTLFDISPDDSSVSTARYTSRSKRRSTSFSTISSNGGTTPTVPQYSPPPPRPPRSERRPPTSLFSNCRSSSTTITNPFKDPSEISSIDTQSLTSSVNVNLSGSFRDSELSINTASLEESSGLFNNQMVSPLDPEGFDRMKNAFGIGVKSESEMIYRQPNDVQHRRKASVPLSVNACSSPFSSTVLEDPIELDGKAKKHYYSNFGSIRTQNQISVDQEVLTNLGNLMLSDERSVNDRSDNGSLMVKGEQEENLSPLLTQSRPPLRRMGSFVHQPQSTGIQPRIPWAHARPTEAEGSSIKPTRNTSLTAGPTSISSKSRQIPNAFLAKPPLQSTINGNIPMPHAMPSDTALTFMPIISTTPATTIPSLPRSVSTSSIPQHRTSSSTSSTSIPLNESSRSRSNTVASSVFTRQYMAELDSEKSPSTPGYPTTPSTPPTAGSGGEGGYGVAVSLNGKVGKGGTKLRSSYSPQSPLKSRTVEKYPRVERGGWL